MPVDVSVLTDCEATTAIDNFNYVSNPISAHDGTWTDAVILGDSALQTDGSVVEGDIVSASYSGYKNNSSWGPNFVAMATITALTSSDATVYIYFLEGAGLGLGTPDGYIVEWRLRNASTDEFRLKRLDTGVETILSSGTLQEATASDKWAGVRNGNDLEVWWKTGGTWTYMATASDATYTANKRVGLMASTTSGGTLTATLDDLKIMNIVTAIPSQAPSPPVIRVRLRAY